MAKNIIETFDLTKIYKLKGHHKEIVALNKANLQIKEGEIFGLLGPNGAGKTTMVQILTTLLRPTSGYALIKGHNILKHHIEIKKLIGLLLGAEMVYRTITGYSNLKFFCKIYGIPDYKEKILKVAKEFELEKWLNQYVAHYSLGMRLKLSLCRALIIDPPILFLDEPTLGLDVAATLFVIDKLKNLNKTIFLTSHNMHVVDKLCHRIAFINQGKILNVGTQEELKSYMQSEIKIAIEIKENKDLLKAELDQQNFIINTTISNDSLLIILKDKKDYKNLFLILSKYEVRKIKEEEMALDNLFIQITQ